MKCGLWCCGLLLLLLLAAGDATATNNTATTGKKAKTFIIFGDLGAGKSTLANCIVSASGDMQQLQHGQFATSDDTETLTRTVQVSYFILRILTVFEK